jgi:hypothetical protein
LGRALPGTGREPGTGHALAQAAFLEEIPFEALELLVEQVVGLVDEANKDLEVPDTWLPSPMFLLPLRAACTIW